MSTDKNLPNQPPASAVDEEGATQMWDGLNRKSMESVATGIHITMFGQTDVGLVREHNEDNFIIADISAGIRGGVKGVDEKLLKHTIGPRGTIFAVCDGMGGAAAGEVASQMAVDTVHEIMSTGGAPKDRDDFARRVVRAIETAGERIFASAKADRTKRGMGTTSTVAGLIDKVLFVGQIGDSRAYVLRGSDFNQVTKDQSLVNQLIEAGQLTEEEAESFEHQNIILQALGTAESVQVDLTFLELKRGDRVMLCSDGLSGLVHPLMIKDVMSAVKDPRACCATLIEMARTGGGHDNITVIVADFDGTDLPDPKEVVQKVAYQQYPLMSPDDKQRITMPPGGIEGRPGGLPHSPPEDGVGLKRADSIYDTVGGRKKKKNQPVIVGAILAVIAIGGLIMAWKQGLFGGAPPEEVPAPSEPAPPMGHANVHTDIPSAELFVDGTSRGALHISAATALDLSPGAHVFEARVGGTAVATETIVVEASGEASDVTLSAPPAAVAPDAGDTLGIEIGEAAVEAEATPAPTPAPTKAPARRPIGQGTPRASDVPTQNSP